MLHESVAQTEHVKSDNSVFSAACLVSYYGHALDEKTPLLRASDAMSREGARLCKLLGMKVSARESGERVWSSQS